MNDDNFIVNLKMLVVITDKDQLHRVENILLEKRVHFHYMFNGYGTASSSILKAFGLSGTEKVVCFCIAPEFRIKGVMTAVVERLEFVRPGAGIAFVVPISGINSLITDVFKKEFIDKQIERLRSIMNEENTAEITEFRHELVVAIINSGFSEVVMDAAKEAGARGGTIINARHSGIEDAVKFFGISLQSEREIVAILVPKTQKKELMQKINRACGLKTEARGIILSLPVESCAGIAGADVSS